MAGSTNLLSLIDIETGRAHCFDETLCFAVFCDPGAHTPTVSLGLTARL